MSAHKGANLNHCARATVAALRGQKEAGKRQPTYALCGANQSLRPSPNIFHFCPSQMTHWHSPRFHAYFPTAQSYPSILGDMLSGALACIGFSWVSSASATLRTARS